MKRYLPVIIVAAVALLALVSTALLYRAKRPPPFMISTAPFARATPATIPTVPSAASTPLTVPPESATPEPSPTNPPLTGTLETRESGHLRGDPDAAVTLEEFGDYECPSCGKLAEPINQMERDFHPRLRVIFYNSPSDIHPHAHEAAYAAEAAALQGRFWEMHDLLFKEQEVWSKGTEPRALFNAYAEKLGMDVDRFKADMESDKVKARVEVDKQKAVDRRMTNSPQFFINGQAVPRILYVKDLRDAVEDMLTIAR